MHLRDYMARVGLTSYTRLAERLNMPVSTVHGWVTGRRLVGVDQLAALRDATGGAVQPRDMRPDLAELFARRKPKPRAAAPPADPAEEELPRAA